MFEIRDTPLDVNACLQAVSGPDKGGTSLFVGTVRDNNQGYAVKSLEYEAYASMAEKEMSAIAAEIERELPGTALSCQHRVGHLELGDIAIVCAASAPHRDEAFRACRALVDRIKERVPIWKREHGPKGPYWVGWKESLAVPEGD